MSLSIGRIGLFCLTIFGIFAIIVPEYMPSVEAPYDKVLHFGVFGIATLFAVLTADKNIIAFAAIKSVVAFPAL
jgi:hypothetical protein